MPLMGSQIPCLSFPSEAPVLRYKKYPMHTASTPVLTSPLIYQLKIILKEEKSEATARRPIVSRVSPRYVTLGKGGRILLAAATEQAPA